MMLSCYNVWIQRKHEYLDMSKAWNLELGMCKDREIEKVISLEVVEMGVVCLAA